MQNPQGVKVNLLTYRHDNRSSQPSQAEENLGEAHDNIIDRLDHPQHYIYNTRRCPVYDTHYHRVMRLLPVIGRGRPMHSLVVPR